jgi:hypothetical protein
MFNARSMPRIGIAAIVVGIASPLWSVNTALAQAQGAYQPYDQAPATTAYPSGTSPEYPPYPAYPDAGAQTTYPAGGVQPGAAPSSSLKTLFASSVGAVLAASGGALVGAIAQGLVGSIVNWFDRKKSSGATATSPAYGAATGGAYAYPPAAPAQTPYPGTSADPGTGAYPGANSYPGTNAYPGATQYGANSTMTSAYGGPTTTGVGPTAGIYAGVAYEVHMVDAAGNSTPVDPGSYVFRTRDRFVVYYRPSLPGYMEVYNTNAAGRQTKIDDAPMAAGQLMKLGPYQFAGATGNESLTMALTPCSTPELLVATRDIVNVAPSSSNGNFQLQGCGMRTRGLVQTRDIQKVGIEGTTSFALDPVSAPELANGKLAPRSVTIGFRHQ